MNLKWKKIYGYYISFIVAFSLIFRAPMIASIVVVLSATWIILVSLTKKFMEVYIPQNKINEWGESIMCMALVMTTGAAILMGLETSISVFQVIGMLLVGWLISITLAYWFGIILGYLTVKLNMY